MQHNLLISKNPLHKEFMDPKTPAVHLNLENAYEIKRSSHDEVMQYRLNNHDFAINYDKTLGQGIFGKVVAGSINTEPVEYAFKALIVKSEDQIRSWSNEIEIMVELNRENAMNINKIKAYTGINKDISYIVMPLATNGSLDNYLSKLTTEMQYSVMLGVIRGVDQMHQYNIIHCDLKVENVLLDAELKPYISDFGLSMFEEKIKDDDTSPGTYILGAVELLDPINPKHVSKKSDIYALGFMLYEILTRLDSCKLNDFYFAQVEDVDQLFNIVNAGFRPPLNTSDDSTKKLAPLVKWCWETDPQKRPDSTQALHGMQQIQEERVREKGSVVMKVC